MEHQLTKLTYIQQNKNIVGLVVEELRVRQPPTQTWTKIGLFFLTKTYVTLTN